MKNTALPVVTAQPLFMLVLTLVVVLAAVFFASQPVDPQDWRPPVLAVGTISATATTPPDAWWLGFPTPPITPTITPTHIAAP